MLQNATPLRKSAPWPPNISDEHVSCTAPATRNASFQILFKCPTPAIVFGNATKPSRFAHFWQGAQSLAPATQNDIWTSKSGPNMSVFNILTSKCASRHNGVHFSTSQLPKHGVFSTFWLGNVLAACTFSTSQLPKVCFVHFDFEMCFAPQRRALFRHLNFQKWSDVGVFCTFWLGNVLRATTACNFSSLIWPHGSAPAALASLLFDPPEPQIIGFSFFWDFLFLDLLSSSLLLSDSSHLCFPICPYCRKFDFKFPSTSSWDCLRHCAQICAIAQASVLYAIAGARRPRGAQSGHGWMRSGQGHECHDIHDV